MISIKVNISDSLRKSFDKEVLKSDRVRFVFREGLSKMVELARRVHKYVSRTGKLDSSIESKLITDSPLRGLIQINDDACKYGKFQHSGTPDHFIPTKNKLALRFVGGDGKFNFSKGHNVSGIKADPFLENAIKKELPDFERELSLAVYKELDK